MSSAPEVDPLSHWPAFAARVRERLEAGRVAYGDKSFSKAPLELVAELQQEALDLAGWGYVLFERLEAMASALAEQERLHQQRQRKMLAQRGSGRSRSSTVRARGRK